MDARTMTHIFEKFLNLFGCQLHRCDVRHDRLVIFFKLRTRLLTNLKDQSYTEARQKSITSDYFS